MKKRFTLSVVFLLTYSAAAIGLVAAEPNTLPAPKNATDAIKEAKALFEICDFDGAIQAASEAIRLDPKNASGYCCRASLYAYKGKRDKSIADYTEALCLNAKLPDVFCRRGYLYFAKGEFDKSIADYTDAIRLSPKDFEAYSMRGYAFGKKQDYTKAIADHSEAVRLNPKSDRTFCVRALAYNSKGDYDNAIADLKMAINLKPKDTYYYEVRACVRIRHGDYDGGIADLQTVMRLDPNDPAAKFDAAPKQALSVEAMKHGEKQVRRMLHDRPAMAQFGEKAAFLRQWAARKFAGEDLHEQIYWDATEPTHVDADNQPPASGFLGHIRIRTYDVDGERKGKEQRFEELWRCAVFELNNIASAQQFARIDKDASEGKMTREVFVTKIVECESDAAEKTRAFYIQVFLPWSKEQLLPSDASLWDIGRREDPKDNLLLANVDKQGEYWRNYENYYDRICLTRLINQGFDVTADITAREMVKQVESAEDQASLYDSLGFAYEEKGKPTKAIASFSEAIRLNPKDVEAHCCRARLYLFEGENDKAIADYTEAIGLGQKDADTYYSRGICYDHTQGGYDKAIADFSEAIRIDPEDSHAYYGRGYAYQGEGNLDKAMADYSESIRLDPNNADALAGRAWLNYKKGEYATTIAVESAVIQINPKAVYAFAARGRAYESQGKLPEAIADFSDAIRLDPKYGQAFHDRAKAYLRQGDKSKADKDFVQAKKLGYKAPDRSP